MNQRFFTGGVHFAPWCKSLMAISVILGNRKRSFRRPLSKSKYMTAKLTTWVCVDGWASEMVKCGTSFWRGKRNTEIAIDFHEIHRSYTGASNNREKQSTWNIMQQANCHSQQDSFWIPIHLLASLSSYWLSGSSRAVELLFKVFFYGPPQRMLQATDNVTPCGRNTEMNAENLLQEVVFLPTNNTGYLWLSLGRFPAVCSGAVVVQSGAVFSVTPTAVTHSGTNEKIESQKNDFLLHKTDFAGLF